MFKELLCILFFLLLMGDIFKILLRIMSLRLNRLTIFTLLSGCTHVIELRRETAGYCTAGGLLASASAGLINCLPYCMFYIVMEITEATCYFISYLVNTCADSLAWSSYNGGLRRRISSIERCLCVGV